MNYFEWNIKIYEYFFNQARETILLTATRRILAEISGYCEAEAFSDFMLAVNSGPADIDPKRYSYNLKLNIIQIADWLNNRWLDKSMFQFTGMRRKWIINPNDPPPYIAYLYFLIMQVRQDDSSYWKGINSIIIESKVSPANGSLLLHLFSGLNRYDNRFYYYNVYSSGARQYVGTLFSQIPIRLEEEDLTIANLIASDIERDDLLKPNTGDYLVSDEAVISIFETYCKPNLRRGVQDQINIDDTYRKFIEDYFLAEFPKFSWDVDNALVIEATKGVENVNEVKLGLKIKSEAYTGKKSFQLVAAILDQSRNEQESTGEIYIGSSNITTSYVDSKSIILGDLTNHHQELKSKELKLNITEDKYVLPSFKEKKYRVFYYHSPNFFLESDSPHNTNRNSFYLLTVAENIDEIDGGKLIQNFSSEGYSLFEFPPNLNEGQFNQIQILLGVKDLGKISLVGEFLLDRRSRIVEGYPYYFEYSGPIGSPELCAVTEEENQKEIKLNAFSDFDNRYVLPNDFPVDVEFRITDADGSIRSKKYCYSRMDSVGEANLVRLLKDKNGYIIDEVYGFCDLKNDFGENLPMLNALNSEFNKLFKSDEKSYNKESNDFNPEAKGNKLLQFLAVKDSKWIDLKKKLNALFPEYFEQMQASSFFYLMEQWRDLGYIDYNPVNGKITVPPPTILFMQSSEGVKAFLTGYRDEELIQKIKNIKQLTNMPLKIMLHVEEHEFFPELIFIHGEYNHIKQLAEHLEIQWNKLDDVLHPDDYVYQLKCLFYQDPVEFFSEEYTSLEKFRLKGNEKVRDHYKKEVFNLDSLKWELTTKDITEFGDDPMLVRYKNSGGFSYWYVHRIYGESYVLPNYHLCLFHLFKLTGKNVLLKRKVDEEHFDLLVLFGPVKLPYWINRSLVLLKVQLPSTEFIDGKPFKKYEGIHMRFLDIISEKLKQKIEEIKIEN
jgi:hypothetical protein